MVADAVKQVADDRQALSLLKNSLRQTEEAAFREEVCWRHYQHIAVC